MANQGKILVVDDDQDMIMGLTVRLKANGFSVVAAADAPTALTVAVKEQPDLVILDLGLPGGHGLEVLRRFRTNAKFMLIPIIILSSQPAAIIEKLSLKGGAQAFFQKPADTRKLFAAIDRLLDGTSLPVAAGENIGESLRSRVASSIQDG